MNTPKFNVGNSVSYTNGSSAVYSGEVKKITPFGKSFQYVIIDPQNKASVELWNAGYAVGDCIQESQIQ